MDRTKTDRDPAAVPSATDSLVAMGILMVMAAGSAALLLLSFPSFDANFLAFTALVPVLLVVYSSSLSRSLAAGIVCGFLFFCLHLFWVNAYLPVVGVIFVTVVYGGCMAACFLVINLAARAFPVMFTDCEPLGSLSVITRVALRVPGPPVTADGVKVT